MKIISFFKNNFNNLFKQYPVTMIVIFLETFFLSFFIDRDFLDFDLFMKIFLFLLFFFIGTIFTEIAIDKKKRIYSYIVFFILSILFVHFIHSGKSLFAIKLIICYVTIIPIYSIYKLFLDSKWKLSKYFNKVFNNFLKTWAIYLVLSFGLLFVSLIFTILIYDDFEIVLRIELFIMGVYLVPSMLLDLTNLETNEVGIGKIIIHYILESLVILSFIIIYIYIFKILITWIVPSNVVFRILGILFIVSLPIWIMNNYYDNDYLGKVNHFLPGAFIPFILMEIFTLYIRIINNGITILRYFGIILILFQIVFIYLYYFKKDKIYYIFHVLIVLIIFSTIIPFMNMFNISYYSQVNVIKRNLNLETLSKSNIEKIVGAYEYLYNSLDGRDYLNKSFDKESLEKITKIIKESDSLIKDLIYFNIELSDIDISLYDKMLFFRDSCDYNRENIVINYQNKEIDVTDEILKYQVNISDREKDDFFKYNNEIEIDNLKIIISYLNVYYTKSDKTIINSYTIEGIILEKNN